MSVSLILGFNLDFSSTDNLVSFVNPVTVLRKSRVDLLRIYHIPIMVDSNDHTF